MNKDIYIYGAGGHAKVVAATARLLGYEIKGFWESGDQRVGCDFFGSKIISFSEVPQGANIFIAFGNNIIRQQSVMDFRENYQLPTLIHPSAQVAKGSQIGAGCYIGALSNIDPDCKLGDACIVNKQANISHDSVIDNGTHISVHATIAGNVKIGECCCIGIGSCIIEKINIGNNVIIGAGAVVISDIPSGRTAVGVPAKVIK